MKKTKLLTSLAAFVLVLGLGACNQPEEEGTSSEADEPVSSESSGGTTEGGEKDLVFGFELDDGLVGIDGGTVIYNEKSYDYEGTYATNLDEAVRVSYEEGSAVGEYYLSFELDGATRWITITEGNYTNLSYTTEKAPLYYNPTYGCWGNEKQTHFLCYNAAYDCLYASSISGTPDGSDVPYIETSPIAGLYYTDGSKVTGFVGDVYQEPTEPGYDYQEPNVGTDTTYRLGALIDEASYRFFNGATTGSTFLGTTQDWDEAAEVYITAISDLENGCTLSTVVDGNLKYIVNTSSTNVTLSDEPTAWTYDSEEQLFIQVSTERGLMYYSSTPSFRAYPNSDDYASYAHVVAYTNTPSDYVPPVQYEIPEPNIGTDPTYKLGALDASAYKYVYLDGKTTSTSSGTFLTTTETFDDAASFYITSVPEYSESNAVTLSYVDSETSSLKYLSSGNSSTTLTYEDDPCVWVWVAEDEGDGYFAVEAASTGRFIALYTSDETARGYAHSNLSSYSHFVAYTEEQTNPEAPTAPDLELVTSLTDGGEYYWAYNDNGTYHYFDGKSVSTYYLEVTTEIDSAVLVKTTAVDGGWKLTFNNDASTIFAYPYNNSLDFEISTTGTSSNSGASSTWEWDTTYNIVTITLSNGKFYPEYYNSRIQGNGYSYINDNGSPKLGFQFYSLVTA